VLIVNAGPRRIVLSTEAVAVGPADLLLLPRKADGMLVPSILRDLRAGGFAVASVDRRQWQAGHWRELRRMLSDVGVNVLATADQGTMHFAIGSGLNRASGPGIRLQTGSGLRPGIWSRQTRANSCAVGL
jgi:hypothetical protein